MKIGSKNDPNDLKAVRDLLQQQEGVKSSPTQEAERLAKRLKAQNDGALLASGGRVDVSLAKAIGQELSPEGIAAERRAKIESLKLQIAEGKYNPPSEAIARSVGEEILFEIFTGGTTPVQGGRLFDATGEAQEEEL